MILLAVAGCSMVAVFCTSLNKTRFCICSACHSELISVSIAQCQHNNTLHYIITSRGRGSGTCQRVQDGSIIIWSSNDTQHWFYHTKETCTCQVESERRFGNCKGFHADFIQTSSESPRWINHHLEW